jgi:biopolymer transport protein ExbD
VTDDEPSELNLTPYLDVLMNLIVFVLVSGAGLLEWGVLPAKRPAAAVPGAAEGVPRVHLSRAQTTLSVADEAAAPVSLDELTERLSRLNGRSLVLDAEPDVTLEQVVTTMDAARKAHFDEVTLSD